MKWLLALFLTFVASAAQADNLIVLKLSGGQVIALRTGDSGLDIIGVFDSVTVLDSDPIVPPPLTNEVTAVVYVYEKDNNAVPLQVAKALQDINAAGGAVASDFEEDTVDGDGQVPDQYKVALDAARKAGLPALVTLKGQTVYKVVKAPKATAPVMEAMH